MCDLIAAEAKYHLPCLSVFKRNAEKAKLETKESDLAMIWLCDELEYADKSNVIKLNDTWNRDMVLAERAEIEIPRSFISLKSTLKDKLLLANERPDTDRPVTRILCGGVLTRPKWTKLPKCIFYLILFNWRLVNFKFF